MNKLPPLACAALGAAFLFAAAEEKGAPNPYRARRDRLREAVLKNAGGPALIALRQRKPYREEFQPFRPDADFHYLTGSESEGGALLLLARAGEPARTESRDTLFFPRCDPGSMQWTGFFPCSNDAGAKENEALLARTKSETGAGALRDERDFAAAVIRAARRWEVGAIYVAGEASAPGEPLAPNEWMVRELRDHLGGVAIRDLNPLLTDLRFVKDEGELNLIRRACAITTAAHRRVARTLRPGMFEYELQGELEHEYLRQGATGIAFPSIVGSGPNGVTLHYEANRRKMEAGELVVVDIGAEYRHYASDLTRTYPVNGRFSARQRQIYTWVYEAQAEAFKQAKPGSTLEAMDRAAREFLKEKVCGDRPAQTCDQYFIHGIGHTVGLETHDRGHRQPFVPGVVVTNEPGIYLARDPLSNGAPLGVRIEDTLIITATGSESLAPPYHAADEVEAAMKGK